MGSSGVSRLEDAVVRPPAHLQSEDGRSCLPPFFRVSNLGRSGQQAFSNLQECISSMNKGNIELVGPLASQASAGHCVGQASERRRFHVVFTEDYGASVDVLIPHLVTKRAGLKFGHGSEFLFLKLCGALDPAEQLQLLR